MIITVITTGNKLASPFLFSLPVTALGSRVYLLRLVTLLPNVVNATVVRVSTPTITTSRTHSKMKKSYYINIYEVHFAADKIILATSLGLRILHHQHACCFDVLLLPTVLLGHSGVFHGAVLSQTIYLVSL